MHHSNVSPDQPGAPPANSLPPPASFGLTSRRIALPTGVELHYVEKGDPQGDALIFLHGGTDSWRTWEYNLPLVSPAYHTYALDQRGHGDSSKPACCYTQAAFAGDVIAFMDALRIEHATVIGTSLGSLIAHYVAVAQPERVQRLVLASSWPTVAGKQAVIDANAVVQTLEDPIDPAFVRDFQTSNAFNPIPAAYLDTVVAESLKVPATVWKQLFAGVLAEDHSARLGAITAKTLILWGDRDAYTTLADPQALHAAIKHSTFITYPATGHALHWEWPQRFVDDLHAFLK
jgi:non-heme chloroperoxidase